MKFIVTKHKTTLTRMSNVEQARHLLKCVMDSNPLTEKELEHFHEVMKCLNADNKLHMRPDTEYNHDDSDFII